MAWYDDVLKDAQEGNDREPFDVKKQSVRVVYEAYRSQGLCPDEAKILSQYTFRKRFNQDREFIDLQEALTENYIMDMYLEEVGEDETA